MQQTAFFSVILFAGLITFAPRAATLKVIYAVNSGGPAFHDPVTGIDYQSDLSGEGVIYTFPSDIKFGGVNDNQLPVYRDTRFHEDKFGYTVPVDGDGEYALLLQFPEDRTTHDFRVMNVKLNEEHIVLDHIDIPRLTGARIIWNEVVYFKICAGRILFNNDYSVVKNNRMRLDFESVKFYVHIGAFVLFKGSPGEGMSVIGTRTVVFFDPKRDSCSPPRPNNCPILRCPECRCPDPNICPTLRCPPAPSMPNCTVLSYGDE